MNAFVLNPLTQIIYYHLNPIASIEFVHSVMLYNEEDLSQRENKLYNLKRSS